MGLFKTKAEKLAYSAGRRDQYNKEHPKLRYAVREDVCEMDNSGRVDSIRSYIGEGFATKKEAKAHMEKMRKQERYHKEHVIKKSKAGTLDLFDSGDCSFSDYELVKINERRK